MQNHEITAIVGKHKRRKRVGRGTAGGMGKTCGRGTKGSLSRAGAGGKLAYEGGQMPLFRRLPKRGFNNNQFTRRYEIVNVSQLDKFDDGSVVDVQCLYKAGLIDSLSSKVKILGDGDLTKKLDVAVHKFSKAAESKIIGCGGTVKNVA